MPDYECEFCGRVDQVDFDLSKVFNLKHFVHEQSIFEGSIVHPHMIIYKQMTGELLEKNIIVLTDTLHSAIQSVVDEEAFSLKLKDKTPYELLSELNERISFYSQRMGLLRGIFTKCGSQLTDDERKELLNIAHECTEVLLPGYLEKERLEQLIKH